MDPELNIAGAFVLKEMKSEPWREVAGEHLKKKTYLPRKEQLQQIRLFERQRRTGCPCADEARHGQLPLFETSVWHAKLNWPGRITTD